jgi:hypothetical protein
MNSAEVNMNATTNTLELGAEESKRQRFRYRTWRPSRPRNVLRVDEATDEVGYARFPREWGKQSEFDQLPLFWRPGKTGIYGLEPRAKRYVLTDVTQPSPTTIELTNRYAAVYRILRQGLKKKVPAWAITNEGRKHRLRPPVLHTQAVRIFGSGTVKIDGERCRIWISKEPFFEWLQDHFLRVERVSEENRSILVDVLTNWPAARSKYSFSRRQIRELVAAWLRIRLKNTDLEQIVEDLPKRRKTGGRPTLRWNTDKAQILSRLEAQSPVVIAARQKA